MRKIFRDKRREKRLKLTDIASVVGMNQSTISQFETGRHRLDQLDAYIATLETWGIRVKFVQTQRQDKPEPEHAPSQAAETQPPYNTPTPQHEYYCPSCHSNIPGPNQAAFYCAHCGIPIARWDIDLRRPIELDYTQQQGSAGKGKKRTNTA